MENKFKFFESKPQLEWVWEWRYPFIVQRDVITVYVLLEETGACCHIFKMRSRQ
jgi:hypothetical protein